jgi:dTDP-glucose 4,6-dehydratase
MDTFIVTGGAGFIGSNLVRHLLTRTEHHIVVLDKITYAAHPLAVADMRREPRVTFVAGDIGDAGAVAQILSTWQPRAVLNLAAETHVDRSIDGPAAFIETNIRGTFVLLEKAREYWTALDEPGRAAFRFLQVSTDEVYGTLGPVGRFSETTRYAPNSPYAASKAAADHLVRAYFQTYGVPVLLTNCSNNYGPYQHPEKFIPLTVLNALDGRPLPVYGDGGNVRDWLHVEDHCAAIVQVLSDGRVGETYNVGAENEQTNIQVVGMICELLEELAPVRTNPAIAASGAAGYRDLIQFVADRPGHDRRYAVDATKLRTQLGWAPQQSFRDGLRRTAEWYLTHRRALQATQLGYDRERLGLGHPVKTC